MTIRMLINATAGNELRIAIVEDGELMELDVEAAGTSTLKGNVYKGVIHNVEASLEAAFVDIGRHKQGFLPFSEVTPKMYPKGSKKPRITEVLKRGQEIVVQVSKDAVGDKGVTLTTFLSLPGRYTVLMPGSDAGGISRKIDDEKVRKRVRTIAQKIQKPEDCGFIVRTAGYGQTRIALQKDLDKVVQQWEKLQDSSRIARAPSVIHSEPDLIGRTLRDFFSEEIDEVTIDTKDEYEAALDYFKEVMPEYADRIIHYQNPIPIFAFHHVEEQIEATFERRVSLPSGGSIVIDETEALVAIDVNSGKMTSEAGHEKTVFKTNCEAAEEVARQLKLRDLGGIVVVDFIDMEEAKHKREVEQVLAEMAQQDKARYKISRINAKGLCVLTRQRIRQGMRKAYQHRCPVCDGTGWLRTPESHSLSLLRRVETRLAQGGVGEVRVLTHRETAEYLVNQKRPELMALEKRYACRVMVMARYELERGQDDVTYLSNKEVLSEMTDKLPPREERPTRTASKRKRRRKRGAAEEEVLATSPESSGRKRRRKSREQKETLAPKGNATFTGRPSTDAVKADGALEASDLGSADLDEALPTSETINGVPESGEAVALDVTQALAVAEAVMEGADVDEALRQAESSTSEDEDKESSGRRRRRRRRGRRRKDGTDQELASSEGGEETPVEQGPSESALARKALLLKIFGAR